MRLELKDLQYAPDADYTQPNILNAVVNRIPTFRGTYKPAYSLATAGYGNVTGVLGGAILKRFDGTVGVYQGDATKLYEANGSGTWTDRSRGGGYTNTATSWQFAVYGSDVIATNNVDAMQRTTGAGIAFADLAGAPKAKCVAILANIALAFNYDDGSRFGDGWKSSDAGNIANWTAGATSEASSGRFTDTAGPINACATLNETVIVWKSRGMYVGRYVGGDKKWDWQLLNADIGCVAPDAWVHTDVGIVFVSERDVFLYDGGQVRSIGSGRVRNTFFAVAAQSNSSFIKLTYEPAESLVYVYVSVSGATGCDTAFAWNHTSDKWGLAGAGGRFGNSTFNFIIAVFRNPNNSDIVSRGFTTANGLAAMVVSSEGTAVIPRSTTYANGETSSLSTGLIGEVDKIYEVKRVTPKFLVGQTPSTDTLTVGYNEATYGGTLTTVSFNFDSANWRFDGLQSARVFQFTHASMTEVGGYVIDYTASGLN